MRWKIPLILFLCIAILVLGAYMPSLVGNLQDRYGSQKVAYAEIGAVQLEFDNSAMTLQQKLALLSGAASTMQVSTDMTQHTSAEIWQIAMRTAEIYREAGLIPKALSAADIAYCIPVMFYWEPQEEGAQLYSNIFWELSIADGVGSGNALTMVIDDRTGTVCTLSYQNVLIHREETLRLNKALETLCSLALRELGEEFQRYDARTLATSAGVTDASASYAAVDIAWEDASLGEIRLAFVVSEVGFYTYTY